ncbi:enoyl-CoA hydratase/isomerase family protein [Rhodocytophaga rosea]|uniref:Enoyl-CoA hydratase/isomerase family protein n=1 Tax=Rhodocytophaga rosea TaxID=2704465 RepID=A0A6C0GFI0_9BACT|nr:enoyl-CoA hydratase-related protein [Rhodocytophaga rosea]QHT66440.1 enoyl-CoA hydratase/isomerase family protein [Rhodocytophaga rosea]
MSLVEYEVNDRIAYLTLNRPDKRNALNSEMVAQLSESFKRASLDEAAKIIVLKANGKVFCAGADLGYLQQLQQNTFEENIADSTQLASLFEQIYMLNKVVIAQIHGHAIAGGCGLATLCDFSFAVPEANFGYTEVKIGFIPAIVSLFLIRKIGEGKARELLLSGELISAEQAQVYGLINYITEESELSLKVQEFARKLCHNNSAQSMGSTKKLMAHIQTMDLTNGLRFAARMNAETRESADCKKGIAAFLNKQEIQW